jgi:hypothetical protein
MYLFEILHSRGADVINAKCILPFWIHYSIHSLSTTYAKGNAGIN